MERNYDEIIADILIQLDVHTQQLEKQSRESSIVHKELVNRMEIMEKMDGRLMEQMVHSATILDRIIRKNNLKL